MFQLRSHPATARSFAARALFDTTRSRFVTISGNSGCGAGGRPARRTGCVIPGFVPPVTDIFSSSTRLVVYRRSRRVSAITCRKYLALRFHASCHPSSLATPPTAELNSEAHICGTHFCRLRRRGSHAGKWPIVAELFPRPDELGVKVPCRSWISDEGQVNGSVHTERPRRCGLYLPACGAEPWLGTRHTAGAASGGSWPCCSCCCGWSGIVGSRF